MTSERAEPTRNPTIPARSKDPTRTHAGGRADAGRLFRLCIRCSNLEIHRHDATLAFAIGSGEGASAIADDDEVGGSGCGCSERYADLGA